MDRVAGKIETRNKSRINNQCQEEVSPISPGGGGGTAIYGLYRYVSLGRVWFSGSLL